MKLRAALRGEELTLEAQLAHKANDSLARMEEVDGEKGRLFAEEVREKAHLLGKPVPMRPVGLLRVGA